MLRSKRGQCLLAIAAGFSVVCPHALAVDATDLLVYSIGPVHLKPQLGASAQFNDNIFYRPDKPLPGFPNQPVESDYLAIVSPGINLQLGRRDANHIFFDYRMDESLYTQHRDLDHREHTFSLDSHLQGNRLSFEVNSQVQLLAGILGGNFVSTTNILGQRVERSVYSENARVEYGLTEKVGLYGALAFDDADYKQGTPLYDQNVLVGTAGFSFNPAPKWGLFGELHYGQSASSPNSASLSDTPYAVSYGGFVGAKGDFTTRLSGSVKVGYEILEFGGSAPGSSSPVVEASLTDKFSDRTTASLSYSRRNNVSVQIANAAFVSDAVSASLTHTITSDGKFHAAVAGTLGNYTYEDSGAFASRLDRTYGVDFALIYNPQLWLSTRLAYSYQRFDSNVTFDYNVNTVTFTLSVGY
jgi:hypothetical protein